MIGDVEYFADYLRQSIAKEGKVGLGSYAMLATRAALNSQGCMSDSEILAEIGNVLKAVEIVNADPSIPWVVETMSA